MQLRFYPNPDADLRASYETIDSEFGGITNSDDENAVAQTYDSEFGAVVDTDPDDEDGTDTFNYEEGAVTGVIDTADKLRVFYIRKPREGYVEVNDLQALQYYCLHKCYEKDSSFQDLKKSMHYEIKFQERVNEEATRVNSAYHGNLSVRGTYA